MVDRPAWPIRSLLILCGGVFLAVTTELIPLGLLIGMSRDLGVSTAWLGLLVTGYAIMVAIFAAPLATLTARLPRRPLLTATLLAYAASNAAMALAHDYPTAVAARLVGGLTHGLFWAILGAYTARLVTPDRVGRAVTLVSSGGALAVLIAIPLGTAAGVAYGWRTTFTALTLVSLTIALLAATALTPVPASTAPHRTPLRQVLRQPGMTGIAATTTITMLGAYALITYTAPLLHQAGLPESQIAPVLLASGLAGGAMLPLAAWLADRRLRLGLIGAILLITAAPLVYVLQPHKTWAAVTAMVMGGMAMGMLPVFLQTATLRAAAGFTEEGSGINASAFNLGVGGGALVGAVAWQVWGLIAVPVVGAAMAAAGLAVYLRSGSEDTAG